MAVDGSAQTAGPGALTETEAVARSIRASEGELDYTFEVGDAAHQIRFRTSLPVVPPADAAAVASLLPAMATAQALRVDTPIGEATLDSMREVQAVLRSWARSAAWVRALPFGSEIALRCPTRRGPSPSTGDAVAAFFSGGVDSLSTVLRHPEITHVINVVGFDTEPVPSQINATVRERIADAARELGKELITVETDLRRMSDRYVLWPVYYGSAMGAVAQLLSDRLSRVLVAGGVTYGALYENGSHPLLDHLWGADRIEVVHDGASLVRAAKVERLAESEIARSGAPRLLGEPGRRLQLRPLREVPANYGRARGARGAGALRDLPGHPLDLAEVAAIRPHNRPEIDFWLDNLQLAVRERADGELIEAVERCLANVFSTPVRGRRTSEPSIPGARPRG